MSAKYLMRSSAGAVTYETVRFFPNTAADPLYEDPGGVVSSIVHSATGKYTITLKKAPLNIVACLPTMSVVGDATDATAQGGVETPASATIVIKTKAGATNTDFAADADTHVNVLLAFKHHA